MESEIEQRLIDFLMTNRTYNKQFTMDLINLLKCYLGSYVKQEINQFSNRYEQCFCLVTTNFAIYARDWHWQAVIVYKLRKFLFDDRLEKPLFSCINCNNFNKSINYYNTNSLFNFRFYLDYEEINNDKDCTIDWLFTNNCKSANKISC